jgi:hypothetical protein
VRGIHIAFARDATIRPSAIQSGDTAVIKGNDSIAALDSLDESLVGDKYHHKTRNQNKQKPQRQNVVNSENGRNQRARRNGQLRDAEDPVAPAFGKLQSIQFLKLIGVLNCCNSRTSVR